MSNSNNCKDGAKNNDDGIYEVNDMLQSMSTADKDNIALSVCANCGKERDDINNTCNKCKQVSYCNAVCKKVHKKKHKKDCEDHVRRAAEKHNEELKIAAELYDEKLFKQPPPAEDCPICFLRLPSLGSGSTYYSCCGKVLCNGCSNAPVYDNQGNEIDNEKCPFCRTPTPASDEAVERLKKRLKSDDPIAIRNTGNYHCNGMYGFPKDHKKALELYHRAGELGHAEAYTNIGFAYKMGHGVEVDEKKATYYYELAAMGGKAYSRHNLGIIEEKAGNFDRALKHFTIAARGGFSESLENVKTFYSKGYATKDDYTKALQAYQEYLSEIKSDQRDKAAAANDENRYY